MYPRIELPVAPLYSSRFKAAAPIRLGHLGIPCDTWGMLCVLGVGVKFPAKGFSTNNATGRQRLRTFDRTIQSCGVSHFKGKPELLLQIFPRIRTCLVSISRCSDCVKAIINDYATGPLQCELAADLQKSRSHCHLPSPHRKALSKLFFKIRSWLLGFLECIGKLNQCL